MNENGERNGFEICIVIEKSKVEEGDEAHNVVSVLVEQLTKTGLIAEKIEGISNDFIKLAAPLETLGRAATELPMKKLTYIGMDLLFEWNHLEAFVRQPDGSLFSWSERFWCYQHLIFGMVNTSKSSFKLKFGEKEIQWKTNESLHERLEYEGIVKDVFPLHDETKRKHLTSNWALNWFDFTCQPIDEIYSYFGTKVATYFVFLGMYTRWLFFPAFLGLFVQFVDFGSLQFLALPLFFLFVVSWSSLFLQFWKRKNSAILARWGVNCSLCLITGNKDVDAVSFDSSSSELEKKQTANKPTERRLLFERKEWYKHMLKIQNNAVVILAIICLQLPFELAYAHLYEITNSNLIRYMFTGIYLLAIQYYTKIGGKMSVKLIKSEDNRGKESNSDSLVYKVFGLYFMQSYIGLFYYVLVHRDFEKLREVLIQRLILFQVLGSLTENCIPYAMYAFKKYKTIGKKKHEQGKMKKHMGQVSRVEKEYFKPSYAASIGAEVEDGLFDDFLELAVQFGMIMMFACAFPPVFCFAVLNNVTEIRADALKLLVMFKRPVPRDAAAIRAWWKIFQLLIVMSICTNCTLLVCLYDQEGKWKLEPGLTAILIMEHILLLVKFGFSHFVPEEPAWLKAKRVRNFSKAQELCSKQLLGSISHLKEQKIE